MCLYMDDGEDKKKGFMRGIVDSFRGDNTHDATGGTVKHDSNENARKGLADSEQQAAKETTPNGDYGGSEGASSAAKANAAEAVKSGNILNRAKNWVVDVGNDPHASSKDRRGRGGMVRKFSPLLFITAALMTYGASSFLGQMAMPISLISQFQGNFDSIGVSNFMRTTSMTRWMLHPGTRHVSDEANKFVRQHSKIYQFFTGDTGEKYFKITDRQAKKLGKKNIEVVEDGVGKILVYTKKDVDGNIMERYEIVADPSQATGGRVLLDDLYESDVDFRQHYHEGTRTWRQAVFDWFDNLSVRFLQKIDVVRNRFNDFIAKVFGNKEEYEGTVKRAVGGDDFTGASGKRGVYTPDEERVDEEGKPYTVKSDKEAELDPGEKQLKLKRGMDQDSVESTLKEFAGDNGIGGKMASIAKTVANAACTVSEIIGAINMLVIAMEAIQILQVASTIFEGIQKTQVDDSKESPIGDIGNSLTKRKETTYKTVDNETVKKNGSAMEANAISALYGNFGVNPKDYSVNSFNLRDSLNAIMNAFGSNMTAYKACTIVKIGAGFLETILDTIDVISDIASIVACIGGAAFTAGASCAGVIGKIAFKIISGVTFSLLIAKIVEHIVTYLVPKIATMMARDLATNIGGEDFGNALVSGANMYMGQNHQYGGGSLASQKTLGTFLVQQQKYIADKARYERETKSPFDASSPYTFMGTLLSKSVPILTQTNSVLSGISNVSTVVGNSLISLVPGASAMTAAKVAEEAAANTAETCPELDSIGAVGDAFCNPYFITDFDTMEEDPAEVTYVVSQYSDGNNFILEDDADNVKVNTDPEESKLMRYILYCGQRSSSFGMADQNIANAIDSGASTLESNVPIWGGIADMLQGNKLLQNFGYISGEACVTQNEGTHATMGNEVFEWKEARYYQRWIEDQRFAESVDLIDKSAVAVALDEYYAEHPIDTSIEGLLAMKSGLTKENVSHTIALVRGSLWIANYDPSDFYPYRPTEEEESQIAIEDYDVVEDEDYLPLKKNYDYIIKNEYSIS